MKVLDVTHRGFIDWPLGVVPFRGAAARLLATFDGMVQSMPAPFGGPALEKGARVLRNAFEYPYGGEVDSIARSVGAKPGSVLLGNLAYDLTNAAACSTFALEGPGAPVLARNLDWAFPGTFLRDHAMVARVSGAPAGPYSMVTWPGFFGGLTAVAPGRFSVAVNFVALRDDHPEDALARALRGFCPVPWAVRAALDGCGSYGEALAMLQAVPLLSPAHFTLAGTRPGEAVVIERAPEAHATRAPVRGSVCVTNHFASERFRRAGVEMWDSEVRLSTLEQSTRAGPLPDPDAAFATLSTPLFLRQETQYQVVMNAAEGSLVVRVPG